MCSINKKEPVKLFVEKNVFEFIEVTSRLRCEIIIRRSTWGFIEADISSDSDFFAAACEDAGLKVR